MKYYVYILFSFSKDEYFIDHVEDVMTEIQGKKNTDGWLLLHHEVFTTKAEAKAREAQIKKWNNREMIEKLAGFIKPMYDPCDDEGS